MVYHVSKQYCLQPRAQPNKRGKTNLFRTWPSHHGHGTLLCYYITMWVTDQQGEQLAHPAPGAFPV